MDWNLEMNLHSEVCKNHFWVDCLVQDRWIRNSECAWTGVCVGLPIEQGIQYVGTLLHKSCALQLECHFKTREFEEVKLIGASLSEHHTSVTSLHPCVCMFACLDQLLTVNHFRLIFCAVTSYVKFKNHSIVEDMWTMESLAPQWQWQGRRPLKDHSVARAIT